LGSTVHVNGKTYTVQDRLAKRYDSRFDIYFESHEKAKQFGIKTNQTVTIITGTK
jgi:3D (Asp-Asp-Asp) domain-containing protein